MERSCLQLMCVFVSDRDKRGRLMYLGLLTKLCSQKQITALSYSILYLSIGLLPCSPSNEHVLPHSLMLMTHQFLTRLHFLWPLQHIPGQIQHQRPQGVGWQSQSSAPQMLQHLQGVMKRNGVVGGFIRALGLFKNYLIHTTLSTFVSII